MRGMKFSFTMAEILISLTIIGVIAAITLPALIGNVNERAWDAQRRALHTRMAQAIAMMPNINGYGEYDGTWNDGTVTVNKDTATHNFIVNGLSKVLKINNICSIPANTDSETARNEFKKCGIVPQYTNYGNSKGFMPTRLSELTKSFNSHSVPPGGIPYNNPLKHVNTQAAAFETANGESILAFYNPLCMYGQARTDAASIITNYIAANGSYPNAFNGDDCDLNYPALMCVNFIYDLNGNRGPNKMYKDMGFMTVFYPTDSEIVAPVFAKTNAPNPNNPSSFQMSHYLTAKACYNQDRHSRVPSVEEIMSLFINKKSFNGESTIAGYIYWTNSVPTPEYAYAAAGGAHVIPIKRTLTTGNGNNGSTGGPITVRCVKK